MKKGLLILTSAILTLASCGAGKAKTASENDATEGEAAAAISDAPRFNADSAYSYVARQVKFGPRVPNTEAHRRAADWMVSELRRHGAEVIEQTADLTAFDGTTLHARNIFGQFNPSMNDRTLLLAHYDCRPWADNDPDPANHKKPVDGANDGASGVGVLLETARQISLKNPGKGIDILLVDAEDWGEENDDDSWALGARYFANNPVKSGYAPSRVIVVDMVGGKGAVFPREYFSQQAAPELAQAVWNAAARAGYGHLFRNEIGGAVTDDHIEFIKKGIPAVDIIEYHPQSGFSPVWHTVSDNMDNISAETLGAVGQTLMEYLYY